MDHDTLAKTMLEIVDEEYSWEKACEYFDKLETDYREVNCTDCNLPLMCTTPFVFIRTVVDTVRLAKPRNLKPHQFLAELLDESKGFETLPELLNWLYR